MKYYSILILVLFAFTGKGQDSAKNLNKHSISFTGGVNVTYPSVSQFTDQYFYTALITTSSSAQPWFDLKYNTLFRQTENSSLGMNMGIGFAQYTYTGTANEGDIITVPALQRTDEVEINTGFFVHEKIVKNIYWYNEIGVLGSILVYKLCQPLQGPNAIWDFPTTYYPLLDLTNEGNVNASMFYQTGITISVSKNLSITPTVEFPLFNVTTRSYSTEYDVNAYNSLRIGIMVTYNFNKK